LDTLLAPLYIHLLITLLLIIRSIYIKLKQFTIKNATLLSQGRVLIQESSAKHTYSHYFLSLHLITENQKT